VVFGVTGVSGVSWVAGVAGAAVLVLLVLLVCFLAAPSVAAEMALIPLLCASSALLVVIGSLRPGPASMSTLPCTVHRRYTDVDFQILLSETTARQCVKSSTTVPSQK
jgi:hypothetical protein